MSSSFALLNLEVYAYLSISLKRLFDLFLEIKKKTFFSSIDPVLLFKTIYEVK